ncbi:MULTISPECIES: ATP-dependent helicase [unclassified Oceanobacillus]|uniref:UvrD-helicase domain-containing protein n=1 Tax=unclassified Oceanobacillus TaxID=2630292 RepID=UPI001BE92320|nr:MULTISPECIES: ATP-dependent helicase [unclassified Oceanobacillus]MBT2601121.1 ATP-dependent helicase [Oceanobacillus sp. ISL-74]MBT2652347.1 ATP-dependent helicase [Oceanobacillus sp. ISL-73]
MAEGLVLKNQFNLVNAPAGSGKTTSLSKTIRKLIANPNKEILCITFTNRAAEQLKEKVDSNRVDISTIHSFIGNFMRPFFKLEPILKYFVEFYEMDIIKTLESNADTEINKLNKYKKRYNLEETHTVTKQDVLDNINFIEYGETQFSSFIYGRLSHNDLLIFSEAVFAKFPKLNMAISQKYSYIFIDEYQDTNSEILKLFYNTILNSETKLVLLGDEMQQIYKGMVGGFQDIIDSNFTRDYSLKMNWRSQENIVKLLNKLYCDSSYQQEPQKVPEKKPKLHIVEDLNNISIDQDTLQLVLYNSDLFKSIGAHNLYLSYKERYKFYDKYDAKEILSNLTMENPDDLIILLVFITEISYLLDNNHLSKVVHKVNNFKYANKELWKIKSHSDKIKIANQLSDLKEVIKKDITIEHLLTYLYKNEIVDTAYIKMILEHLDEELDFKNKINNVKFIEFTNCYKEMKNPKFSTQHAVKGEGHDRVALLVTDGKQPNVKMYLFLELFSKGLFNYEELNLINKEIKNQINTLSYTFGKKVTDLKAVDYNYNSQQFETCISNIKNSLMRNKQLFHDFFAEVFIAYDSKLNISNFKKCISATNRIEGVLLAYKLFYVGCSRAKRNLDVYVTYSDIENFKNPFITKMKEIEFEVKTE